MWNYEKRLQYPVKITQTNPKIAKIIISQFGGPDGELAASMRYLSQRYTMPYKEVTGTLIHNISASLGKIPVRFWIDSYSLCRSSGTPSPFATSYRFQGFLEES